MQKDLDRNKSLGASASSLTDRLTALLGLAMLLGTCAHGAGLPVSLRAPAIPLVVHDPYFSIWSPGSLLTDTTTTHWTGKAHPLRSLVRVDGQTFRVLGTDPAQVPSMTQTEVEVLPTRTICHFGSPQVELTLTFMTPALPSDLEVLSRPVTYVTWEVKSADAKQHAVQVYFDAGAELAVNTAGQEVVWERPVVKGLNVLKLGSKDQPVLGKKGDDLRIDWGYLYLAGFQKENAESSIVGGVLARSEFQRSGHLPVSADGGQPIAVGEKSPALCMSFDLGQVDGSPVSREVLLAYDDELSIKYFREKLKPYWRRNGDDARELLVKAAADYKKLVKRCAVFDEQLIADLTKVGGKNYAALCSLAYRQTFGGNKIVADAEGHPLMFPKENFSNGCIGTVDVLFPQAPFFLVFSPALTKAMLVPILDYAGSSRWPYPYAPHDLGTYPNATGQVYGMEGGDGGRMPVEESGNMLIMLTGLARVEGNTHFVKPYWPILKKWADYCVKEGLDPENQLCSADMFGHLPRCSNLALKAIIGIGGYAQLCEMDGNSAEAQKYQAIARDYAQKWQELSKDQDHTRLAYNLPGSWGMKHNLIWDRALGLYLFPVSVGDAEVAWYLKVQGKYGLPVDNRTDTSLIDWAVWSIAPARNSADFQALLDPIFHYANETSSRVPLSDWFVTTDAKQKGFQARSVVGGIFVRMLADSATWSKWGKLGANVTGRWAPISIAAASKDLVYTAQREAVPWRYTLETPGNDWFKADFQDSSWKEGVAGFGSKGTGGLILRTDWTTKQIWLRREFTLPDRPLRNPRLLVIYDEDPEIYINGVLAAKLVGYTGSYDEEDMTAAARATLKPGKNVIAVHASQTYGGQCIDVGMVEDSESTSSH